MQFSTILIGAFASMVAANSVHFINQDNTERTIIFTAQAPLAQIESIVIPPGGTGDATFPDSWIGNWYSVSKGKKDVPGMLGEVRFNGYEGHTYFDVSAIIDPNDQEGVKMITPKNFDTPFSGCQTFPCANAYNKWDDLATLSTPDKDLICLLGNLSGSKTRSIVRSVKEFVNLKTHKRFARDFVTGPQL